MTESSNTKKSLILQAARQIGVQKWTPAEIDQLRRRLIAEHGEAGKTGSEYIADVLEAAGLKLELTLQEEAEDQYEEEFEDLLHFKTLEDAEVSVMRLDELMRKFRSQGEHAAVERVLNVARLGKRRAEMISRNQKVGSASGSKIPMPSSIGSTCENSPRNSKPSFPRQDWSNELSRQRSGQRRSRSAPFFPGRGSIESRL
jgi:hypothetical protein